MEIDALERAFLKNLDEFRRIGIENPIKLFWKLWEGTKFKRVNEWNKPVMASAQDGKLVRIYNETFYEKQKKSGEISFKDEDEFFIIITHELAHIMDTRFNDEPENTFKSATGGFYSVQENRPEHQHDYVAYGTPDIHNSRRNPSEDWAVAFSYLIVSYEGQDPRRNEAVIKIIEEIYAGQ